LTAERAAFATESLEVIQAFHAAITRVKNLGDNDIYRWYLASSNGSTQSTDSQQDLKLNLIWPCTAKHIKKYSDQQLRMVTETPEIYRQHVRPFMQAKREEGHLNWVFNILEGRTEQEDVIMRDAGHGPEDAFLMLPDLNWDRKTLNSLHLLALVHRRDIWSLRDLQKKHIPWLKYLRKRVLEATVKMYPDLEEDQLKLYVHCKTMSLGLVILGISNTNCSLVQTNPHTTISTSTSSMSCWRRVLPKLPAKPLDWRISSRNWRPCLAVIM
jgi:m7GpppX diphosphatase